MKALLLTALLPILCLGLVIPLEGCKTQLAPDGPYQGNVGLYVQDDAIVTANHGLRAFLQWETDNRLLLPASVSQGADHVRTNLFEWNQKAIRLRDAYALSPSGTNEMAFRAALNELQQALIEATIVMAKPKGK